MQIESTILFTSELEAPIIVKEVKRQSMDTDGIRQCLR